MGVPLYKGAEGEETSTEGPRHGARRGGPARTSAPRSRRRQARPRRRRGHAARRRPGDPLLRRADRPRRARPLPEPRHADRLVGARLDVRRLLHAVAAGVAEQIADVATQHIVEDLVDWNWGPTRTRPRIVFDEIGAKNENARRRSSCSSTPASSSPTASPRSSSAALGLPAKSLPSPHAAAAAPDLSLALRERGRVPDFNDRFLALVAGKDRARRSAPSSPASAATRRPPCCASTTRSTLGRHLGRVSAKEFAAVLDELPTHRDDRAAHQLARRRGVRGRRHPQPAPPARRPRRRRRRRRRGLAASFIAAGADELVMAPNSELIVHDAWGLVVGNADDMRRSPASSTTSTATSRRSTPRRPAAPSPTGGRDGRRDVVLGRGGRRRGPRRSVDETAPDGAKRRTASTCRSSRTPGARGARTARTLDATPASPGPPGAEGGSCRGVQRRAHHLRQARRRRRRRRGHHPRRAHRRAPPRRRPRPRRSPTASSPSTPAARGAPQRRPGRPSRPAEQLRAQRERTRRRAAVRDGRIAPAAATTGRPSSRPDPPGTSGHAREGSHPRQASSAPRRTTSTPTTSVYKQLFGEEVKRVSDYLPRFKPGHRHHVQASAAITGGRSSPCPAPAPSPPPARTRRGRRRRRVRRRRVRRQGDPLLGWRAEARRLRCDHRRRRRRVRHGGKVKSATTATAAAAGTLLGRALTTTPPTATSSTS
jgi:hypothetical protein